MTDFHKLYTRYATDIYRFALYLCGDKSCAEEITAETFARVLTKKEPLVSETVKGYLLTIARNLYLESLRSSKRITDLPEDIIDSERSLENDINQKIELEELQIFLQEFPEVDRTALLLKADGISYREISKVLNISLASAKVKVHRVRLKLAEWRSDRK